MLRHFTEPCQCNASDSESDSESDDEIIKSEAQANQANQENQTTPKTFEECAHAYVSSIINNVSEYRKRYIKLSKESSYRATEALMGAGPREFNPPSTEIERCNELEEKVGEALDLAGVKAWARHIGYNAPEWYKMTDVKDNELKDMVDINSIAKYTHVKVYDIIKSPDC